MRDRMFDEFEPVSSKQWKQKIQVDLKGADYNNTLIWNSLEGIDVKPFYTKDNIKTHYSTNLNSENWSICQSIYVFNVEKSNQKALKQLLNGVESLHFIIPNKNIEIDALLKDIDNKISLYFTLEFLSKDFITNIVNKLTKRTVFFNIDIISNLAKTGNWFSSLHDDHDVVEHLLTLKTNKTLLSVDLGLYQEAGANIIQQLAYALAHANEYINHFGDKLKKIDNPIVFNTSIGSNYFFEIAKLKALRLLYSNG
jgi:methylmalonyl-CoA mutase